MKLLTLTPLNYGPLTLQTPHQMAYMIYVFDCGQMPTSGVQFCSADNSLNPQAGCYRFVATIIGRTVVSVMRAFCGAGITRVAATTGRFSVWT